MGLADADSAEHVVPSSILFQPQFVGGGGRAASVNQRVPSGHFGINPEKSPPVAALYTRSPLPWRLEERVLERSTRASIGKAR
jgi:hypothetical protein